MKIGFLQFKPDFGKVRENISKIEDMISDKDFDLLVLPELANSGYLFTSREELEEYSERASDGIFCSSLLKICSRKNCFIVSGFCERAEEEKTIFYNSSILAYPGNKFSIYRKVHLFNEESKFFAPGNLKYRSEKIYGEKFGEVSIGMMICLDWLFPEATRTLALQGAQIICHPSNLVMPYCQRAMYARSVENGVFIITANRIGEDINGGKEVTFTGESVILSSRGDYLARATKDTEECIIIEVNPEDALNKFINEHNHLFNDRRKEFYFIN